MGVHACVGGLTINSGKAVRLFDESGEYPMPDTYRVGQRWRMNLKKRKTVIPPHVEDVLVSSAEHIETTRNMKKAVLELVKPWMGSILETYEGKLTDTGQNYYLAKCDALPACSTGFWIADQQLLFRDGRYRTSDGHSIAFAGLDAPHEKINRGELVRLSLAGWWNPNGISKDRCYLQISGSFG